MELMPVEIIGIVEKDIYRKRSPYTSTRHECNFQLETGEDVWCQGFIPDIRKGWKVKVIGTKKEGGDYIYAESVEVIKDEPPKQKGEQLKLGEFDK